MDTTSFAAISAREDSSRSKDESRLIPLEGLTGDDAWRARFSSGDAGEDAVCPCARNFAEPDAGVWE